MVEVPCEEKLWRPGIAIAGGAPTLEALIALSWNPRDLATTPWFVPRDRYGLYYSSFHVFLKLLYYLRPPPLLPIWAMALSKLDHFMLSHPRHRCCHSRISRSSYHFDIADNRPMTS
jgi:hypothetical protein